ATPIDITFIVAADAHLGAADMEALNRRQIEHMNAIPGTPYPAAIGGKVGQPLGVLLAGDMTNTGDSEQWRTFTTLYGLTGKEGLLKYPIYECVGNHDRAAFLPQQKLFIKGFVDGEVSKRHGGLSYSWEWNGVRFICLSMYPNADNIRWLQDGLAGVGRETPVVIYFHYSITGPYSEWWSEKEKDAFAKSIEGYNIVGIFHGHYHNSYAYKWRGFDVFDTGSARHYPHCFMVVHITDKTMSAASWDWGNRRWYGIFTKQFGQ
ncbi:MAG: hypothetical protein EHM48_05785, partial [Planctomycetaceae bacterium]